MGDLLVGLVEVLIQMSETRRSSTAPFKYSSFSTGWFYLQRCSCWACCFSPVGHWVSCGFQCSPLLHLPIFGSFLLSGLQPTQQGGVGRNGAFCDFIGQTCRGTKNRSPKHPGHVLQLPLEGNNNHEEGLDATCCEIQIRESNQVFLLIMCQCFQPHSKLGFISVLCPKFHILYVNIICEPVIQSGTHSKGLARIPIEVARKHVVAFPPRYTTSNKHLCWRFLSVSTP